MADGQRDYVELQRIKNRCIDLLPITSALSILTLTSYLGLRLKTLLEALQLSSDFKAILCSALYLVVEAGLLYPNFLNHLLRCLARPGQEGGERLRLLDTHSLPSIDVFITCAGEDTDTIKTTTEAACALDYPLDCFRVIVLDDAGSKELSRLVDTIKQERSNLSYTARRKGTDHHFKAGNLNHGYKYAEELEGGPAPFIAALDADMIPDPQLLRALMPHLLIDEELALIQPPQRFYDVPSPDLLVQGLDINYRITEPIRETMGSTWCGGSGYIVRRTALDSIGGFPIGSLSEDSYFSNVLLGKGWKIRHVDESLQYGRVPESYKAHTTQQSRWHVGRIQTAIAMRFYVFGEKARNLSIRQRSAGLIATWIPLANISTTIAVILLPVVILFKRPLIVSPDQGSFRTLLSMANASLICEWLDNLVVSLITGYKTAFSEGHASHWIAPYHAVAIIDAFSPRWLRPNVFEFSPSGAGSASSERDLESRAPLGKRLVDILWNNNAAFHVSYLVLLSVGVARSLMTVIQEHSGKTVASCIEAAQIHLGWPRLLWLNCLTSMAIPLLYAVFPPTTPNREELLKRDPVRKANYPRDREAAKGQPSSLRDRFYSLLFALYTISVVGLEWYLP